ncbi:hypothetical protein PVL29_026307 [Vitis rotundifolia]|uniref:Uncharacterized protein n=1 Tax=Vitis rotundifolia TaxID=103349 RepID=A0AA38YM52_VITRO|nr:hypothetical protein PVL29_026307 [Vitis rotundifolia]
MAISWVNRVTRPALTCLAPPRPGVALGALGLEDLLSRSSITRRCISERRHLSDHNATSALEFSEMIAVRFQNFRSPSNLGKESGCGRDEMMRLSLGSLTLTALAARMRKRAYSLVGGVAQ